MTEVGLLLMSLPFVSIFIKPIFCALADRWHAHKQVLIFSLLTMAAGCGSCAIYPFFIDSMSKRIVWYCDVVGILIGFSAFSVAWSLGDSLAVNAAIKNQVPWAYYRVWSTISWGVFGELIGQINETPLLPKYTPAFIVMVASLLIEVIILIAWRDKSDFEMSEKNNSLISSFSAARDLTALHHHANTSSGSREYEDYIELSRRSRIDCYQQNSHMLTSGHCANSTPTVGQADAKVLKALANSLAVDLRQSIRSRIQSSLRRQDAVDDNRTTIASLLENFARNANSTFNGNESMNNCTRHDDKDCQSGIHSSRHEGPNDDHVSRTTERSTSFVMRRLSRIDSLCARAGIALALAHETSNSNETNNYQVFHEAGNDQSNAANGSNHARRDPMLMSTLKIAHPACAARRNVSSASRVSSITQVSNNNAANSVADIETNLSPIREVIVSSSSPPAGEGIRTEAKDLNRGANYNSVNNEEEEKRLREADEEPSLPRLCSAEELQVEMLKLIVVSDITVIKFFVLFALFGILMFAHSLFIMLYLQELCTARKYNFSRLAGAVFATHAITETFSFLVIVPSIVEKIDRRWTLLSVFCMYGGRYAYYARESLAVPSQASAPLYLLLFAEAAHGFAYAIVYSLITDVALECVKKVEFVLPKLDRLFDKQQQRPDARALRLVLRASMQSLFSAAFDGLGAASAALLVGLYIAPEVGRTYTGLWRICAFLSLGAGCAFVAYELLAALVARVERRRLKIAAEAAPSIPVPDITINAVELQC